MRFKVVRTKSTRVSEGSRQSLYATAYLREVRSPDKGLAARSGEIDGELKITNQGLPVFTEGHHIIIQIVEETHEHLS